MEHKCNLKLYKNPRTRRVISYRCDTCGLIVVVKKRAVHRLMKGIRVPMKQVIVDRHYNPNDVLAQRFAFEELFGYEAVHSNI